MKNKHLIFSIGVGVLLILAVLIFVYAEFFSQNDPGFTIIEGYHTHSDFLVVINDEVINFAKEEYMEAHQYIHLHDMNGYIVHFHKENQTLTDFFGSLNMNLSIECFSLYGQNYCNNETHELRIFVNDTQIFESDYVTEDLDRILILYGLIGEDPSIYLDQVSDEACIYSHKCPERGEAPFEECGGDSCIIVYHDH